MLRSLKITEPTELFYKFNFSWFATISLTAFSPLLDAFLPVITQLSLLAGVQIFSLIADAIRLKFLNQNAKTKISQKENKIEIDSDINQNSTE